MSGWMFTSLSITLLLAGPDPVFVDNQLADQRLSRPGIIESQEHAGHAVLDSVTGRTAAMVNGILVEVTSDGRLRHLADNVQGHDVDVRFDAAIAVSREPGHGIVLHHFGTEPARRTVLSGEAFFHPRLSPDGSLVMVHESRAAGSRIRVLDVRSGAEIRRVAGVSGAWHPQGRTILLSRIEHDSRRILAATLVQVDLSTGTEHLVVTPSGRAPVEPALSQDGQTLAFVDALTDQVVTTTFVLGKEVSHAR